MLLSVTIDFPVTSKGDAVYRTALGSSCAIWNGYCDHIRNVLWENTYNLSAAAGATEFCEWINEFFTYPSKVLVQASFMSMIFSCLSCFHCYTKSLFCEYQQNRSDVSKSNLRQANSLLKIVLECTKLGYADRTRDSISLQKLWFATKLSYRRRLLESVVFGPCDWNNCPLLVKYFWVY